MQSGKMWVEARVVRQTTGDITIDFKEIIAHNSCHLRWTLDFDPAKVLLLGTNGKQTDALGSNTFNTFGFYYRLLQL